MREASPATITSVKPEPVEPRFTVGNANVWLGSPVSSAPLAATDPAKASELKRIFG